MAEITLKKDGFGLQLKTFQSTDGKNTYLILKESDGAYNAFVEVEAKEAALNCGSTLKREEQARKHWTSLWK